MIQVNHAGGVSAQNVHLINIYLPNQIAIQFVQVTECSDISGNFGAIIGMDIITLGDFSISNFNRKTSISFRIPSLEKIDYIPREKGQRKSEIKVGRNDPCFCGSGKKYKYCCGKNV